VGRAGSYHSVVTDSWPTVCSSARAPRCQHGPACVCLTGPPRRAKLAPQQPRESHARNARDGHCTAGQSIPRGGASPCPSPGVTRFEFACTPAASVTATRWSCRATCRDWYTRHSGHEVIGGYRCDRCGYRGLAGRHACRGRLAQRCLRSLRPLSARNTFACENVQGATGITRDGAMPRTCWRALQLWHACPRRWIPSNRRLCCAPDHDIQCAQALRCASGDLVAVHAWADWAIWPFNLPPARVSVPWRSIAVARKSRWRARWVRRTISTPSAATPRGTAGAGGRHGDHRHGHERRVHAGDSRRTGCEWNDDGYCAVGALTVNSLELLGKRAAVKGWYSGRPWTRRTRCVSANATVSSRRTRSILSSRPRRRTSE